MDRRRRDEIQRDYDLTRHLESPATAAVATPELHTVDFASEQRPNDGCGALSMRGQAPPPPEARGASRLDRPERTADLFFER